MDWRLTGLVFVSSCLAMGNSQDAFAEWQAKTHISVGIASIEDISSHQSIGTGQVIDGFVDGQLDQRAQNDTVAGVGFAITYHWVHWSCETELAWRYRTDWDLHAPTPSLQTITNIFTDVGTTSLLVNLSYHDNLSENWRWHAGAGIGYVSNQMDGVLKERAVPNQRAEVIFKDSNRTSDFAWNLFFGFERSIKQRWSISARYRYIELGDIKIGPFPGHPAHASATQKSHELMLGVSYSL